jgi:hypothetical protein
MHTEEMTTSSLNSAGKNSHMKKNETQPYLSPYWEKKKTKTLKMDGRLKYKT